jgi:urease accessory protein
MLNLSENQAVLAAANLLLVADGRFPAGGYAHSSGLEQAIARGRVTDEQTLHSFLAGNLTTVGRNTACFAASACEVWRRTDPADKLACADRDVSLAQLSSEESARIPSPALREASRAQGRQFLRAAAATWPQAGLPKATIVSSGVHLSMAQGLVAAALDLDPRAAALLSGYASLTGPAAAAVKLLGLDPFSVNRVITSLGDLLAEIVDEAGDLATCNIKELPCRSAPLLEIGAQLHAIRQPRMFAS